MVSVLEISVALVLITEKLKSPEQRQIKTIKKMIRARIFHKAEEGSPPRKHGRP